MTVLHSDAQVRLKEKKKKKWPGINQNNDRAGFRCPEWPFRSASDGVSAFTRAISPTASVSSSAKAFQTEESASN